MAVEQTTTVYAWFGSASSALTTRHERIRDIALPSRNPYQTVTKHRFRTLVSNWLPASTNPPRSCALSHYLWDVSVLCADLRQTQGGERAVVPCAPSFPAC